MSKTINKNQFIFNNNFITDLRKIMKNKNDLYFYFYKEKLD